jgi:Rrf2 family protein
MLSILEQMITGTTISAIRALLFVAQNSAAGCLSPRRIAEALGESPTYLAKVSRSLVKAGILRAEKGAKGGVRLGRAPREITMLAVVEACQGAVLGDYCRGDGDPEHVCGYHRVAVELQQAIVGVLSRWNLAQLLRRPRGRPAQRGVPCLVRLAPAAARAGAG